MTCVSERTRREMDTGSCYVYLGDKDDNHIFLGCPETGKWGGGGKFCVNVARHERGVGTRVCDSSKSYGTNRTHVMSL